MARDEWDPFQELVQLRKKFSALFERSLVEGMVEEPTTPGYYSPPVDVFQEQNCVHVLVEVPGIKKEDVDIQLHGNSLIIRGTRNSRQSDGQTFFHRIERQHGPFERVIDLHQNIDVERITAQVDLGVLMIKLPIRQGPIQKKIELSEDS